MTIGERIKKLRKEKDLTQEKLADYLCVSYQAVSKWECGISSPDLALIGPLTKLLGVTSDELLGLTHEEADARRTELENAYKKTWKTGDIEERYRITSALVAEYPGDMKYLDWLAWTELLQISEIEDDELSKAEEEKLIPKFLRIIEDADDETIRNRSITGIVAALGRLGRREEARKYAELYPDTRDVSKDTLLDLCLIGEEQTKHRQWMLLGHFYKFLNGLLQSDCPLAWDAAEKIVNIIFPDGNYFDFHTYPHNIHMRRAGKAMQEADEEAAIRELKKAYEHICEYHAKTATAYRYSTPIFDRIVMDMENARYIGTGTFTENFLKNLRRQPEFEPLWKREDFKTLVREWQENG